MDWLCPEHSPPPHEEEILDGNECIGEACNAKNNSTLEWEQVARNRVTPLWTVRDRGLTEMPKPATYIHPRITQRDDSTEHTRRDVVVNSHSLSKNLLRINDTVKERTSRSTAFLFNINYILMFPLKLRRLGPYPIFFLRSFVFSSISAFSTTSSQVSSKPLFLFFPIT